MATVQITLDDRIRAAAEERAAASGFDSLDGYVSSLIDADAAVAVSAELEADLIEGLAGTGREILAADWEQKKRALAAAAYNGRTDRAATDRAATDRAAADRW